MRCKRCGKEVNCFVYSYFDSKEICLNCETKEKNHSNYKKAKEEELRQCKLGNYNFIGIGKPNDL